MGKVNGVILLVLTAGCSLVAGTRDLEFEDADGGPADAATDGAADAGPECLLDSECTWPNLPGRCEDGACVPGECEPGNADCDGELANGCETDTDRDPTNCGGCGTSCDLPSATAECRAGACAIGDCDPSFADCDGDEANGCEADLGSAASCGSCDAPCDADAPVCDTTGSEARCVESCSSGTLCGTRCVNTDTDPGRCGDCDTSCSAPLGARATCEGGTCGFACDAGRGDCSSAAGCETDLNSSVMHCGACDSLCEGDDAIYACTDASCTVAACEPGFDDCDDDPSTGCEAELATDADHCGGCGLSCDAGESCVGGVCDPVVDVGTSGTHGCAVRHSGRVLCWGTNPIGQLGNGTLEAHDFPTPVLTEGGDPFLGTHVAAGESFSCAIDTAGALWCWGRGLNGELGGTTTNNRRNPWPVVSDDGAFAGKTFVQLTSARSTTCARAMDGSVWCWGRNDFGQASPGGPANVNRAVELPLSGPATDAEQGGTHGCAALTDGTVECWGRNIDGTLGDGTTENRATVVQAVGLSAIDEVAVASVSSCARRGGTVWCWGAATYGSTGLAATTATPTEVPALAGATGVHAGSTVTCVTRASDVACIGENRAGYLGRGTAGGNETTPAPVVGLGPGALLHVSRTSCAIEGGRLRCWGDGRSGQLGAREGVVRRAPTATVGLASATAVSVSRQWGCGITAGALGCWGFPAFGTLGTGDQFGTSMPVAFAGVPFPTSVDTSFQAGCAIGGGDAYCWGSASDQRFGTLASVVTPTELPRAGDEDEVVVGPRSTCVRSGGSVYCAGRNAGGELGRGTTSAREADFGTAVVGIDDAVELTAGRFSFCARRASGGVACWGEITGGGPTPVAVPSLTNAIDVEAGTFHACAIETASAGDSMGQVRCWGSNDAGQLGASSGTTAMPVATTVVDAVALAAGDRHTCAIRATGEVVCWGNNHNHQLGDGTRTDRSTPTAIPAFVADVADPLITAGDEAGEHTCARGDDDEIYCWGECWGGGCATGVPLFADTPTAVVGL